MRIKSIEYLDIDCEVFDIEVEEDHSYVVEGIVLHNCVSCANAEANSPYEKGTQPRLPLHPACRCINIPVIDRPPRPTVRDKRSVKDIPVDERTPGKIGTTKMSMEQFWNSFTDRERLEYLGPDRFKLYKQGNIKKLSDLVNPINLRPLTIAEINARTR